jgi:hypothetical protein
MLIISIKCGKIQELFILYATEVFVMSIQLSNINIRPKKVITLKNIFTIIPFFVLIFFLGYLGYMFIKTNNEIKDLSILRTCLDIAPISISVNDGRNVDTVFVNISDALSRYYWLDKTVEDVSILKNHFSSSVLLWKTHDEREVGAILSSVEASINKNSPSYLAMIIPVLIALLGYCWKIAEGNQTAQEEQIARIYIVAILLNASSKDRPQQIVNWYFDNSDIETTSTDFFYTVFNGSIENNGASNCIDLIFSGSKNNPINLPATGKLENQLICVRTLEEINVNSNIIVKYSCKNTREKQFNKNLKFNITQDANDNMRISSETLGDT